MILKGLYDPSPLVVSATGLVLGELAEVEYPEKWPMLVKQLQDIFNEAVSSSQIGAPQCYGSLKALQFIAEHLDERDLNEVVPGLLPFLVNILNNDMFNERFKTRAFNIIKQLFKTLANVIEQYEDIGIKLLQDMLGKMTPIIGGVFRVPSDKFETPQFKTSAAKVLQEIVSDFGIYLSGLIIKIFPVCIHVLQVEYERYYNEAIANDNLQSGYDSDNEKISIEVLVCQFLELIITIVTNPEFYEPLLMERQAFLMDAIDLGIKFSQMTSYTLQMFEHEGNQFLANDDSDVTWDVRTSGSGLFVQLLGMYQEHLFEPIINDVWFSHWKQTMKLRDENAPIWWKLRDACLFAFGSSFGVSNQDDDFSHNDPKAALFVDQVLRDLVEFEFNKQNQIPPILMSRALWVIYQCAPYIKNPSQITFICNQCFPYLAKNNPIAIRLNAARAIGGLLSNNTHQLDALPLQNVHASIVIDLVELLELANDQTLHIVLEALTVLLSVNSNIPNLPHLLMVVYNCFIQNYDDPLIPCEITNLIGAIGQQGMELLLNRFAPPLIKIIRHETNNTFLIQCCIQIITKIVQLVSNKNQVNIVMEHMFLVIFHVAINHDDADVCCFALECLRAFVHRVGPAMHSNELQYNDKRQVALHYCVDTVIKFLDPQMPEDHCSTVGTLLCSMIVKYGNVMGDQLCANLLNKAIIKLCFSKSISLIRQLVFLFGRLIVFNQPLVIGQLLSTQLSPEQMHAASMPNNCPNNGLQVFIRSWLQNQSFIYGDYENKVLYSSLGQLLLSGDDRLNSVRVPLLSKTRLLNQSGYNTRLRKKRGQVQETTVEVEFLPAAFVNIAQAFAKEVLVRELESKPQRKKNAFDYLYAEDDTMIPDLTEDEDALDPYRTEDPLNSIVLYDFLKTTLQEASKRFGGFHDAANEFLDEKQLQQLQTAFQ
mmetsp:Transcript_9024/g.13366  ORF Transcript_9024/g.13366 Transcript_9024/m.13366 type:complete len:935 (+) Transcript_9024:1-2805(+)